MASYKAALEWIALNEDTSEVEAPTGEFIPTVTMSLVIDLWKKQDRRFRADLLRTIRHLNTRKP